VGREGDEACLREPPKESRSSVKAEDGKNLHAAES